MRKSVLVMLPVTLALTVAACSAAKPDRAPQLALSQSFILT